MSRFRLIAVLPLLLALGGCNFVVLAPTGDIAAQQRDMLVISTLLMLLIIIPVMALTAFFAWKYRQSNTAADYAPDWDHSTQLELVIWSAPLLIIICLGALTWIGTHLLDPYRPLDRIAPGKPVAADVRPLEVDVVALDWKWLFIYPEQGVATVNELAVPVDRPITFRITASSVMNAFYVPTLAGMIYAMPGMETKLHAVANAPVTSTGFSANYSGAGFSGMKFGFMALSDGDFDGWIAKAKTSQGNLTKEVYLELEKPSENAPVQRFATVDPVLFDAVLNMCVETGKMCMKEMMAIDAKGGLGREGANNVLKLTHDKYARRGAVFGTGAGYVLGLCTPEELTGRTLSVAGARAPLAVPSAKTAPAGLPGFTPISLKAGAQPAARAPSNI
ncbi:ubiquinol oxidase subunit II [Ancylobacter sp. 6x-1]|uniref:Ubiquinol oxidase polypeptide II n=1 Tax=Ancylobacter crimeensis TaxID=2579147 RepID=A0ABT0D7D4_9HYPH|nr:ubiquinol oxidase subunit II [Ancylobacter crimeensis]MCK0195863.1 ubiquinol oxidase subunit II [Ancylobacter crimeensis]